MRKFPLGTELEGPEEKKDYIRSFNAILRLFNILATFDKFEDKMIFSWEDRQDYMARYIQAYEDITHGQLERENIIGDIVFEAELVQQIEVNIDYILELIEKYNKSKKDPELYSAIERAISSSMPLRSKKALIMQFIETINADPDASCSWPEFVRARAEDDLAAIIADERLDADKARRYVRSTFERGELVTAGAVIDDFMPPMSRFHSNKRADTKARIIARLGEFFGGTTGTTAR